MVFQNRGYFKIEVIYVIKINFSLQQNKFQNRDFIVLHENFWKISFQMAPALDRAARG